MTTLSGDQFTGKPVQRRELLRGSVGGDTMWQTKPPRKVLVELCSKGRYDRLYRCENLICAFRVAITEKHFVTNRDRFGHAAALARSASSQKGRPEKFT
jgi:hypothetical protein